MKVKYHDFDVVVIGAGGAGMTAAIYTARAGLKTAVISKVHPLQSHTVAAQGGINAALGNIVTDDWRWHMYDTIKAADWLADQDAVEVMCREAKEAVNMLATIGVDFTRNEEGLIDQKPYGGQSTDYGKGDLAYRACYSKDRTGPAILTKLYEQSIKEQISFFNYHFAIELIMQGEICRGVITWDIENGRLNAIIANHVIIATGGYSQIYQTATSAAICSGDGNGLCVKAGINLQDMEFIQFHPTAISSIGVLITEAARSAGGVLLNNQQERFMSKYAPKFMELASRDVIARAIATEISQGRGCGDEGNHVLLDLTHLTLGEIKEQLPTVYENCQTFLKLDPSKQPIPVAPAAHYTMGGIPTNSCCQVIKYEQKKGAKREGVVKGLYAIGEAACISVHGAGRLGCNSLLDLIVFAKVVAETIVKEDKISYSDMDNLEKIVKDITTNFLTILSLQSGINSNNIKEKELLPLNHLKIMLKSTMQKYVGIFRNKANLQQAVVLLDELKKQYKNIEIKDKSLVWNCELQDYLEFANLLISAEATVHSALWREESRGAHWRVDYPDRNDKQFLSHTIFSASDKICIPRLVRQLKEYVEFFQPTRRIY